MAGVCHGMCVLLWLSVCVRGAEVKFEEDESGVIKLNKENFDEALRRHTPLLVHFYAPLSGESLGSMMEFSKAAAELRDAGGDDDNTKLGGVDVSKEKELANQLNVTAVPVHRLFLRNTQTPVICPVLRDADAILTWLKRREGPSADVIDSLSQLERFTKSHDLAVLGLYKDLKQGSVKVFYSAAADVPDLPFAVTHTKELFTHVDTHTDSLVILREGQLDGKLEISSGISKDEMIDFIRIHEFDLVTEYNGKTAPQILNSVQKNHLVLFINKTTESFTHTLNEFHNTAARYRGQVLCILIDTDEPRNGRVLEFFRVRYEDAPLVRMVNLSDASQYQLQSNTLHTHTLTHFIDEYLQGKAKRRLQSEPVPEGWDAQPVKELVGLNFDPVAFNDKNNVLVLFYAPWSEESRALFPLWEELARRYRNHDNVVIARIDVTANDVNLLMMERHPTIKLFPALYAQRVIPYDGERNADALVEFMTTEMKKAKKEKAKEEKERRKYIEKVKAAEAADKKKEEL
ncbi:protein disulfide-isomerase [Engraulis encrasicolus]|uniref:protein disulfide-isomerase n=1 Tax=Engraulis encrasicolus TaxID=184585 RepID=UPI002FD51920